MLFPLLIYLHLEINTPAICKCYEIPIRLFQKFEDNIIWSYLMTLKKNNSNHKASVFQTTGKKGVLFSFMFFTRLINIKYTN